jgi:hypothetical protein
LDPNGYSRIQQLKENVVTQIIEETFNDLLLQMWKLDVDGTLTPFIGYIGEGMSRMCQTYNVRSEDPQWSEFQVMLVHEDPKNDPVNETATRLAAHHRAQYPSFPVRGTAVLFKEYGVGSRVVRPALIVKGQKAEILKKLKGLNVRYSITEGDKRGLSLVTPHTDGDFAAAKLALVGEAA